MKSRLSNALLYSLLGIFFLNATQVIGQGGITTEPGTKTMPGENSKPAKSNLRGEYSKDADCVDLYVHKGCVNYTVSVPGGKFTDAAPVKVCVDPKSNKPTNICRIGAKKITVRWEKLDATTNIEFKPVKNDKKQ